MEIKNDLIKETKHMISQACLHDALSYGKCFTGLGQPADYIPELARVNKHQLGVCIVNLDQEILKRGIMTGPSPFRAFPNWSL